MPNRIWLCAVVCAFAVAFNASCCGKTVVASSIAQAPVPVPAAPPSFTMTSAPTSLSAAQGTSVVSTITTTVQNGFSSSVNLQVISPPSGVTASFSPASFGAPGSGKSTLTLQVASTAAAGQDTITIAGAGGGSTGTTTLTLTITPAQPAPPCSNCYASVSAGSVLNSTKYGDYNDSANILESTHLGAGTPQIAVGLSYRLPIYGPFAKIHKLQCKWDAYAAPNSTWEARATYCFPYKAFISFKFTPDASQTFNGYTFGLSHAIAYGYLDFVAGLSFSAFNEVAPGFQQAAIHVVSTQQAANNPYYAQYNLAALEANNPTAFDGFPVQLLNADGTTGPLIYQGSPLISHYHPGLFLGVSVPLSFKTFLGAK